MARIITGVFLFLMEHKNIFKQKEITSSSNFPFLKKKGKIAPFF